MLIDDVVFTDLTPASVREIIEGLKRGDSPAQIANPAGLPRDDVAYVDALTRTTVRLRRIAAAHEVFVADRGGPTS